MSKVGISLSINVSMIEKARLFKGAKGVYLDCTAFVDLDELNQYGNSGMVTQNVSEEERKAGTHGPILGNSKVFWKGESKQSQSAPYQSRESRQAGGQQQSGSSFDDFNGDVPF